MAPLRTHPESHVQGAGAARGVPRPGPAATAALTLFELLVAMALGLVVAFTAYAGFNAAVETVAKVGALSEQNRMLRVGLLHALEDVDFWGSYDRPDHTGLRAEDHPFHPMAPGDFSSDQLAWQRSSFFVGSAGVLFDELGNYALAGWAQRDAADHPVWTAGNDHHLRSQWLLHEAGLYAMVDYLPANATYHYYHAPISGGYYHSPGGRRWQSGDGGKRAFDNPSPGVIQDMLVTSAMAKIDKNPNWPRMYWPWLEDGSYLRPASRQRFLLSGNSFWLSPNPDYGVDGDGDGVNDATVHNHWWLSEVGWRGVGEDHVWNMHQFVAHCAPSFDLMPGKPPEWPGLRYFVKRRAAVHPIVSGHVEVRDPIEGGVLRLNFASLGTTLRGARLQRGLDHYLSHYGPDGRYAPSAGGMP